MVIGLISCQLVVHPYQQAKIKLGQWLEAVRYPFLAACLFEDGSLFQSR